MGLPWGMPVLIELECSIWPLNDDDDDIYLRPAGAGRTWLP